MTYSSYRSLLCPETRRAPIDYARFSYGYPVYHTLRAFSLCKAFSDHSTYGTLCPLPPFGFILVVYVWVYFESLIPLFHIKRGAYPLLSRAENVLYMRTVADREPPASPTIYSGPFAAQQVNTFSPDPPPYHRRHYVLPKIARPFPLSNCICN